MILKKAPIIILLLYFIALSTNLIGQTTSPNIVFILADDLGNGDLSYNNPDSSFFRYTPNIDRMCEQGIYFSNFYAHHVCSPTRAGLLTGKHYTKVGSGNETGGTLYNNIPNVAKDLQANGYATGAFGKWHNSYPNFPAEGNGRIVSSTGDVDTSNTIFENFKGIDWGEGVNAYGFDRFVGYYSGGGDYFSRYNNWHKDIDWWTDQSYTPEVEGYVTDLIGEAAIDFIETNKDQPFYCYVPMETVHEPLQVKLSDLQELCSFFPGTWEYIKDVTSPTSGRKISEVQEIKCEEGAEFDWKKIDPGKIKFERLIYATMLYSMDNVLGNIFDKLQEHNLRENTIVFFCSDNGATSAGLNTPFRGSKKTLWEGGIHVPAAIWWPGNIDTENLASYSSGDNVYDGFLQYLDYYPTIMSLAGLQPSAADLDGLDASDALLGRTEVRPEFNDPYFGVDIKLGAVRAGKWKLHYNEVPSSRRLELYDLETDPAETFNVQDVYPEVRDELIAFYLDWYNTNNLAFSYLPVQPENIPDPLPSPEGDIMEIKANQTVDITNGNAQGVLIRFTKANTTEYVNNVESGDRIEFDIFVPHDSENDQGFFYTPGRGWNAYYNNQNGVTQDSLLLSNIKWPRNKWLRKIIGIGNNAALGIPVNYISLYTTGKGYTHFYLDNIILRKNDGTIRTVIWDDNSDFINFQYRYQNNTYSSLSSLIGTGDFPFTEITVETAEQVLPEKATILHPENGATDVTVIPELSWTSGGNLVQHKIYFGTSSALTEEHVVGSTYETNYKLEPLTNNTTYYWRVDGINGAGVTIGDVWNFTTEVVTKPAGKTGNPFPMPNTHVSHPTIFTWKPGQEAISYNVHFGKTDSLKLVSSPVDTFYTPDSLENNTKYYWRVDAVNTAGSTEGDLWNFSTTFDNIAPLATIFVTSESENENASGEKTTDGIFGYDGTGEWLSDGEQTPMVQLRWPEAVVIDKVVLYDLAGPAQVTAGKISFSDGSFIDIPELPDDGSPYEVTFEQKSVKWIRFQILEAVSEIRGLAEIEVFEYSGTSSTDNNFSGSPVSFALEQNYPNPFNPATTIRYRIPSASVVKLQVFDILGREITTLVNEYKTAGEYSVRFNNPSLTSGVYYYRLTAEDYSAIGKMLLVR